MSQSFESPNDQYALIDFGGGRKLERFGRVILDRPSPAAVEHQRSLTDWSTADLKLNDRGDVIAGTLPTQTWRTRVANIAFNLRVTPFGHVGIFPEQLSNWQWLQSLKLSKSTSSPTPAPQALNLFAYTGGSTMALAKAGFEVVHVDASAPSVRWARDNAETNQLQQHPIRWIVEDARKFAAREVKRDRHYDLIVLDPPSFGHGPSGDRWQIESDLFPLLEVCLQLINRPGYILLTAHSVTPSPDEICEWLSDATDRRCELVSNRLSLVDHQQRQLDSGFSIRCSL